MKRGKFSLSNYKLFTADMGELIPCGLIEVLPGDTIQQSTSALVRCSPLVAPVMHPVQVRIHHWYVPHRLVWDGFEDFITGGPDGEDVSTIPTVSLASGAAVGSLGDYLGIPTGINNLVASALPYRAYATIWNEFYRDQDLQTELTISTGDGPDTTTNQTLQNVGWEKDYFTSARPWEQKGPSITIPIGSTAPVEPTANAAFPTFASNNSFSDAGQSLNFSAGNNSVTIGTGPGSTGSAAWKSTALQADLSDASAVTINVLREAFALQRFAEARARFGSRYTEYLRYLGVRSSDARLQRPEYLGGGKQTIQFSEVLATAETDEVSVGDMKGHGIGAMRSNRYRRFIEEHGYIMSLMSVKPRTMYSQGLPRHWNRRVREDFWQRELQHIGQQEVLQKEIYYAADGSADNVFGYQDRYDEYRRQESTIAGEFRTSTLDYWHMARIFSSAPALNDTFVKSVPTKRNFVSNSTDVLYVMANHSIQARRLVAPSGKSFIF